MLRRGTSSGEIIQVSYGSLPKPVDVNFDFRITMKNSNCNTIPIRRISNDVAEVTLGLAIPPLGKS